MGLCAAAAIDKEGVERWERVEGVVWEESWERVEEGVWEERWERMEEGVWEEREVDTKGEGWGESSEGELWLLAELGIMQG